MTKSTEAMANSTEGEAVRTAEVRLEQTVAEASVLVKPKVVDASKRTGSNAAVTRSRSEAGTGSASTSDHALLSYGNRC